MSKTIELEWLQDPSHPRYPLADRTASLVAVHQPLIKAAQVWRRNGVWVNNLCFPDGFESGPKPSFATDAEARQHAESALGVVTVPEAPAIPLRWVLRDRYSADLCLGDHKVAEVYLVVDSRSPIWQADSRHKIRPRNENYSTRDKAMRAVEAAFGIASPLPVETAVAP